MKNPLRSRPARVVLEVFSAAAVALSMVNDRWLILAPAYFLMRACALPAPEERRNRPLIAVIDVVLALWATISYRYGDVDSPLQSVAYLFDAAVSLLLWQIPVEESQDELW
jgi:hypothetical protein